MTDTNPSHKPTGLWTIDSKIKILQKKPFPHGTASNLKTGKLHRRNNQFGQGVLEKWLQTDGQTDEEVTIMLSLWGA